MITFLSGGTGTPKLIDGVDDRSELTVICNTGDDIELGGQLVCPDIDTVLFTTSGLIDRDTWWGIEGDPTTTHTELRSLAESAGLDTGPRYLDERAQTQGRDLAAWRRFSGVGEFMQIGDRDRAIHITRTGLLDEGRTLTAVTRRLTDALSSDIEVLPMSNDPVASLIHTPSGIQHFQAWWVAHNGNPPVRSVEFRGADTAEIPTQVRNALHQPVIIGPSNPVTSIGPMLALEGVEDALASTPVVAVSPFIEDHVFSGPAPALMQGIDIEPSTRGVVEAYPFVDAFVLDQADQTVIERPTIKTDTEMTSEEDASRVFEACKHAIEEVA